MSTINEKIDALGKQFAILQAKIEEQKGNSEKKAKDVITEVKSEINRLSEETRVRTEQNKSHISVELQKAQMNFNTKKEELKAAITTKKYKSKKQRVEAEANETAEYAAFVMDSAILTIDEAILAFYETTQKLESFDEKNGN